MLKDDASEPTEGELASSGWGANGMAGGRSESEDGRLLLGDAFGAMTEDEGVVEGDMEEAAAAEEGVCVLLGA